MLATLRQRLDSWPMIIVFGLLYFASQIAIAVIVHPLGSDMLFVQTTLSAEEVRAIFAKWDAAGLAGTYAAHYRFDMIHPLWYAVFLASMLAKGFDANDVSSRANGLILLPFVAGCCDVIENTIHLRFLADRANITQTAVLVANGSALAKWAILAGSVLGVVVLALSARRGRKTSA